MLLLSSEPFPFTEAHDEEFRALADDAQVVHVDGTLFSWYGSRLLRTPDYFASLSARLGDLEGAA